MLIIIITYLDLHLVPPAPMQHWATRLFHRFWSLATGCTPLELTFFYLRPSWKDLLKVFFGWPLFLFPFSGVHDMAAEAIRSCGKHRICPANIHLIFFTIFWRLSIWAIFSTSSFVTRSCSWNHNVLVWWPYCLDLETRDLGPKKSLDSITDLWLH